MIGGARVFFPHTKFQFALRRNHRDAEDIITYVHALSPQRLTNSFKFRERGTCWL